jgi:hypothetical protein
MSRIDAAIAGERKRTNECIVAERNFLIEYFQEIMAHVIADLAVDKRVDRIEHDLLQIRRLLAEHQKAIKSELFGALPSTHVKPSLASPIWPRGN